MEVKKSYKQSIVACLFLLALAFLVYVNTFDSVWTYDDFPVIVDNPDSHSWAGFLKNSYPSRPLRELTYLLDHALFGMNPAGWHIQNIFWHGLNAGLLCILLVKLGTTRLLAWTAALLFLTHPLAVEVVANISHRKDSLALAFILLATLTYQKALVSTTRKRILLLFLTTVCYLLSYMAKQVAVLLPVMLMVFEAGFVPKDKRFLLRYTKLWVALIGIGALSGLTWLFCFGGLEKFTVTIGFNLTKFNFYEPASPAIYYATVLSSFCRMLFRVVWPVNLAAEYAFPVPTSFADPWSLGGLAVLALIIGGLFVSYRRNSLVFFGLTWGMLFWLPVSNIWPLAYFAADRYWYVPLAGFCILVAKAIDALFEKRRSWQIFVVAVILVIMVTLTWQQSKVWQSPMALWTQAVAVSPSSPFALNNLGASYLVEGDAVMAKKIFEQSFSVNPRNPTSIYNLGMIAEKSGDHKNAYKYYMLFLQEPGNNYQEHMKAVRRYLRKFYGIEVK